MTKLSSSDWHYPRPQLAAHYLEQFDAQPGPALTIFAKRRIGKTTFLINDLMPAAIDAGYLPVYIDFWETIGEATEVFNNAIEEQIRQLKSSRSALTRLLTTKVSSLSWFDVELAFADDAEQAPENPLLQLRFNLKRLIATAKRPVCLILDEAQQISLDPAGDKLAASLRSALLQLAPNVKIIFSGSSEARLSKMLRQAKAPLYNFSTQLLFPKLDRSFVQFVAAIHKQQSGKDLSEAELFQAYRALNEQPGALIEVVSQCRSHKSADVAYFARRQINAAIAEANAEIAATLTELKPLDYELLVAIAHGVKPSAKATRAYFAAATGTRQIFPNSVTHALNKLHDRELLTVWTDGTYRIASDELWRYLTEEHPSHPLNQVQNKRHSGSETQPTRATILSSQ